MIFYVAYDFVDDKARTKFSNFLKKYGRRIQYSVFEIKNSKRVLNLIRTEIEQKYQKHFANADTILIIPVSDADTKKIDRF